LSVTEQPNGPGPKPSIPDLQHKLRTSRRLNIGLAAMVAFLFVVVVTQQVTASTPSDSAATPSATAPTGTLAQSVARDQADDPMAWGDPKAPVVMVQWTDFRCPFCASFAEDSLPSLFTDYIDTGKVRFEIHDVAFFGDQSVDAAAAVRAAGKQGKAHEYMVAMFDAAPSSGHPDLPAAKLIGFAKTAGVPDLDAFAADLADPAVHQQVIADTTKAQQMGVTSVPYFVIGGQVVSGAQPLANFRAVIDTELANS
jgi:protein-disulfide isomerase